MAPLFWLNLFIFFSVVYILFLISNYFLKVPEKTQATAKALTPNKLSWKW
uniref:ATP synthase Fo subunit 8 n=1 Tax=Caridina cf. jeani 1 VDM-2018 TaxID=2493615 RepID=A0A3Q8LZU1_9EUCA|nr:ATP synthase Fo subunit 8 [Caridina cf. jeani 1 VDM-2018]AZH80567.1 ATP synthase Fo subunit 8 [Caridina cf. jeani 1 VDM-2018]